MNAKKIQEIINHFIEVVSKDRDIDLSTFYHNLETLNVVVGRKDKVFNSGYDNFNNEIYFSDDEHYNGAINHELFHCASTKVEGNISHSGFYEYNDETKEIYGLGLNEGYTEILHQRFFGAKNAYSLQKFYITKLEQIIDPNMLKKMYFASDLNSLVNELSKYTSFENINRFMYSLDIYTLSQNTNRDDLKFSFQQIQEAISYCSSFLSECYIQKLIKDNPDNIKSKAIDFLNDFNKEITHNNNDWNISMAVPIDEGYEILGKVGIEKPKDLEVEKMEEKKNITYQDLVNTTLEDAGLSVATFGRLYAMGIHTLADVFTKTDEQLMREVRNFGAKRLEELHSVLAPYEAEGLYLGMPEDKLKMVGTSVNPNEGNYGKEVNSADYLYMPFEKLGLPISTIETLKKMGIYTLNQLLPYSAKRLSIRGLTSNNIIEIEAQINSLGIDGLHLGMSDVEINTLGMSEEEKEKFITDYKNKILSGEITIDALHLYDATRNILAREGAYKLIDLLKLSDQELLSFRNLGQKGLAEIKDQINSLGIEDLHLGLTDEEISRISNAESTFIQETNKPQDEEEQIIILHEEISDLEVQKREKEERMAVLNQLLEQKRQLEEQNRALDQQIAEAANQLGIRNEMNINGISR